MPLSSRINVESLVDLPVADDATVELGAAIDGVSITVRLSWANGFSNIEIREGEAPFDTVTVPDEFARSFAARAALLPQTASTPTGVGKTTLHIGYLRWAIGSEAPTGSFSWEAFTEESEKLQHALPSLVSEIGAFVRATKAQLQ
jgi:hypothetical protein